jgi:hypothetical protein
MSKPKFTTLENWKKELIAEIERFERDWLICHENEPDSYPLELVGKGEWDEQFAAFQFVEQEDLLK